VINLKTQFGRNIWFVFCPRFLEKEKKNVGSTRNLGWNVDDEVDCTLSEYIDQFVRISRLNFVRIYWPQFVRISDIHPNISKTLSEYIDHGLSEFLDWTLSEYLDELCLNIAMNFIRIYCPNRYIDWTLSEYLDWTLSEFIDYSLSECLDWSLSESIYFAFSPNILMNFVRISQWDLSEYPNELCQNISMRLVRIYILNTLCPN
jgi:hypothetical protein